MDQDQELALPQPRKWCRTMTAMSNRAEQSPSDLESVYRLCISIGIGCRMCMCVE
jgi:hypothetical protein